jgi:hypothetical protein
LAGLSPRTMTLFGKVEYIEERIQTTTNAADEEDNDRQSRLMFGGDQMVPAADMVDDEMNEAFVADGNMEDWIQKTTAADEEDNDRLSKLMFGVELVPVPHEPSVVHTVVPAEVLTAVKTTRKRKKTTKN